MYYYSLIQSYKPERKKVMKQTTKRVLSVVLSVLMLISAMSVFTFAENNYKPDEEYYNRIISDAVIVNPRMERYV